MLFRSPPVHRGRPDKADRHRALGDILESIAELRYYRDHFLVLAPAPTVD